MLKCIKKNKHSGFTLIELIVVLLIISILSVVAVPMYRGYIRKAMATEGKILIGSAARATMVYYSEHGVYYSTDGVVSRDLTLEIDARLNRYFPLFEVRVSGSGGSQSFKVETNGVDNATGIKIVFDSDPDGNGQVDTPAEIIVTDTTED